MGIAQSLTAQGVKPTGVLGWLAGWIMSLPFRSLHAKSARLLDLQPEDDVLDVACGSGAFLPKRSARRWPQTQRRICDTASVEA